MVGYASDINPDKKGALFLMKKEWAKMLDKEKWLGKYLELPNGIPTDLKEAGGGEYTRG